MPRIATKNDDWDDDDRNASDEEDEGGLIDCPHCGREIYDAPMCPHCEQYVTDEVAMARPKPWWLVFGVVACLYAVYHWIF